MSEESSDGDEMERVRFRVSGDSGDGSSSVVAVAGEGIVGDEFCLFEEGGIGVPSHMVLCVMATARCLFHYLPLGLASSSSIVRLCLAGALP